MKLTSGLTTESNSFPMLSHFFTSNQHTLTYIQGQNETYVRSVSVYDGLKQFISDVTSLPQA